MGAALATGIVTLLVCSLLPRPVSAQESSSGSAPSQPSEAVATFRTEVVVTPERGVDRRDDLPVSTAILSLPALTVAPAATLADVVQMLPGFQVAGSDVSGTPAASIARGFFGGGEAEYVSVIVDGIPLGDPESGVVDWRQIPALAITRVEALRGPASAMYGDASLGGVIQLFTAMPNARAGRVNVGAGSFGTAFAAAEYGQPLGNVGLQALGAFTRSSGARANAGLNEAFSNLSIHKPGARQWAARGLFNYADRHEPGALDSNLLVVDRRASDPLFRFDKQSVRRGYGAVRYASASGPIAHAVVGYMSARTGSRVRTLLFAPGLGDTANRDFSTRSVGASVENSLRTTLGALSGQLRFGMDLSRDLIDTDYRSVSNSGTLGLQLGSGDGRRLRLAGYGTQSLTAGRATLFGGIRWDGLRDQAQDRTRATHSAWSPRAGAAFALGQGAVAFAHASGVFKAPTLDQLFDPRQFPDFQGGTFLLSNRGLRPQRGANLELGLRQASDRHRWEALVYRLRMRDEIDFDPATFSYANIGRSTHTGFEIDGSMLVGTALTIDANYAWTQVAADAAERERRQLKNIPRHVLRPSLTLSLPSDVTVHARYTRTAGAFADDDNDVPLGDRSTLDIRITKRVARVITRVDLLNIANDRYEEVGLVLTDFRGSRVPFYYPAAGFTARAAVELIIGGGRP